MSMRKKIFIALPSLNIGGAETALIGMLQTVDYSKVDVDLFMYSHEGPFIPFIPKDVNVLPEVPAYAMVYRGNERACLKRGLYRLAFRMLLARLRMKLYVWRNKPKTYDANYSYQGDELTKALPDINPGIKYDLAISFVDPHSYVLNHVPAKKYIGWIHSDYEFVDVNRALEGKVWKRLDKIISISKSVEDSFAGAFPELKERIMQIENIISPEFVRRRGDEFLPIEYEQCKNDQIPIICSMGRICYQKNFECIPDVAKRLVAAGIKFKWFVIGPGDSSEIEALASDIGVANQIVFLGPRANPCPYVKNCTLYVQPSRSEGKSIAVREAQILGKPVVITNYQTAPSQVVDGKDGIIVPMDNDSIAKGIERLLKDKSLQASIKEYLAAHDYGNEEEINKIYELAGVM